MSEVESEVARIIAEHGVVGVLKALTKVCFTLANPELNKRPGDYYPYHGWRQLGQKMQRAADYASDLRM